MFKKEPIKTNRTIETIIYTLIVIGVMLILVTCMVYALDKEAENQEKLNKQYSKEYCEQVINQCSVIYDKSAKL